MKTCYINSAVAISAQSTFEVESLDFKNLESEKQILPALYPEFKNYIAPAALRRMSKAVRMGVAASKIALENAKIKNPDAILTGTGMGCIADTELFLESLIAHNEDYLTPTAFIQSTHNTVGAQIALGLKCKSYNNTYVNANVSFESALLDAKLCLEFEDYNTALVGGIDELGKTFVELQNIEEQKKQQPRTVPVSEGATFFALSTEKTSDSAILKGLEVFHHIDKADLEQTVNKFLEKHQVKNVDTVIIGHNGDNFDSYFDQLLDSNFKNTPQIRYKDKVGEYFTVSAFALFLGYSILKKQSIPNGLSFQNKTDKGFRHILIYNQNQGKDHSFILLSKC
jgi:3-oxoacyl-[acyl-carrier-protein] synthase II